MPTPTLKQTPLSDRLLCSVDEACDQIGLSRQTVYRWMNEGLLESRLIHRRRRIVVSSLLKILELEPEAG
jgi:excisionase family DNA binding protein